MAKYQEFDDFRNQVLTTKHAVWFSYFGYKKQRMIFRSWVNTSRNLEILLKTPSLKKFLYNARNDYRFKVPARALRKNVLRELLE
jgi:hypothetical protein